MIFCKKNFFLIFLKVPKKAPGNRIANFLNLNQCIIKYQNCQKRLQVNWLIIKVPKKAPGNRITNFLRVTGLGLKKNVSEFLRNFVLYQLLSSCPFLELEFIGVSDSLKANEKSHNLNVHWKKIKQYVFVLEKRILIDFKVCMTVNVWK